MMPRYKLLILFVLLSGVLVTVICCIGAPVKEEPYFAKRLQLPGLENAAKVSENLYRGAAPNRQGLASLKTLGIKTIVDFRETDDYREEAQSLGFKYFKLPFGQTHPPSAEMIEKFFSIITAPDNTPVFVHCREGQDRTGAMIALYRIRYDGWKNDAAYNEALYFGFHLLYHGLAKLIKDYRPPAENPNQ
jgi:protein tyrosine phosphatase (PTP) superfamily phosphohydrolase (DUF442 family)